jgi:uncharacterized protein YbjT (DUF2867 family)
MLRQSKVFLDEAKKAGVKHLVHLGACGDDNTTVAHWAWHQLIERYIEWCRFTFTHLRPEGFMQNLLGYGGTRTILDGTIKQYYGGARISWVDCDDVAEVAVCALTDTERHNGQTYRLGYDAKSFYEIADILTEVIGQPFSYDERSPDEFWQGVLSSGAEPTYMRSVYEQQFDYPAGKVPGSEQTYDNFEPITGKKPVDWYEFARKHAAEFRY